MNMEEEIKKPLLQADEQIQHLKDKGITFNCISEEEAKDYLRFNNNLFRISSYRKNYRKRKVDNSLLYVSLDFAYLKDLAIIDMKLRNVLSKMVMDIEHYTKMQLLSLFESHNENGYSIVSDYFNILSEERRKVLLSELKRSQSSVYCHDLYEKYLSDSKDAIIPVWVFMELVPFGSLIDFYKFCSERYNDKTMKDTHYLLKTCKSVRNAVAHNNCMLNDLRPSRNKLNPNRSLLKALSRLGISYDRKLRRLNNQRILQIATVLFTYNRIVTSKDLRASTKLELIKLEIRMLENLDYYSANELIVNTFTFLQKIFDNFEELA